MPRIRTLKPEHRHHRKVGRLSDREYRLWVALILEADDEGRLIEDLGTLRLAAFGYFPDVTPADVEAALDVLERSLLIRRYVVECSSNVRRIIWFPSWHDHQRIDRPRPSLLPPYVDSSNDRRTIDEHSSMPRESSSMPRADLIGSDRKGSDRKGAGSVANDRRTIDEALGSTPSGPARTKVQFHIAPDILATLDRCRTLGTAGKLRDPTWWQAEVRANRTVDYPAELLRAEAWIATHPERAPRTNHARFMHSWFARASNGAHP